MLNLILDSGAYTAWKSGKPIALQEYCDFLKRHNWIKQYIALDHISPGDPDSSANLSFLNYQIMRERGLDPIPVFHIGEDFDWLDRILDEKPERICLAGLGNPQKRAAWYELCWQNLVNKAGQPIVKVHALGEAREDVLRQHPWSSSDSTTWQLGAQMDARFKVGGRLVYMRRNGEGGSQDIDALQGADRKELDRLLALAGLSPAALDREDETRASYHLRAYLMARHYLGIEANLRKWFDRNVFYILRSRGLFFQPRERDVPAVPQGIFNLHLVLASHATAYAVVAASGAQNVLFSYAHFSPSRRDQETERLYNFLDFPEAAVLAHPAWAEPYNLIQEKLGAQ